MPLNSLRHPIEPVSVKLTRSPRTLLRIVLAALLSIRTVVRSVVVGLRNVGRRAVALTLLCTSST